MADNVDFWDEWDRLSSAERAGRARRYAVDGAACARGFDRVLAERISYAGKDHDFYSYAFPKLKLMRCWNGLSDGGDEKALEELYGEIGFLRPCDRADFTKTGGDGFCIEVEIRNGRLSERVLAYYRERASWPSSAEDLRHDMAVVWEYMDFCAECTIDNILHNSLADE